MFVSDSVDNRANPSDRSSSDAARLLPSRSLPDCPLRAELPRRDNVCMINSGRSSQRSQDCGLPAWLSAFALADGRVTPGGLRRRAVRGAWTGVPPRRLLERSVTFRDPRFAHFPSTPDGAAQGSEKTDSIPGGTTPTRRTVRPSRLRDLHQGCFS